MKGMKITPPEGYIIDKEKSTIYNIVFKKKNNLPTTWEEFCKQNPIKQEEFFISAFSQIKQCTRNDDTRMLNKDENLLSTKKMQKLILL